MILTIGFVDKENKDQLNISVTPRIVDVSFTPPNKLEFIMVDDNGVSQKFGCDPSLAWFGVHLDGCDLGKLNVKKIKGA